LDRPSAEGDLLVGELAGRTSEGLQFIDEEEARIILDPEAGEGIPGLIDALIGLEAGEERTFTLVIPEDFKHEELAGDETEFEVKVDTVYERILPELDDDLARTVGNYESFDELKDSVRDRMRQRLRAQAEGEYAEEVLEAVIDGAEVSYPSVMVEEGVDDALESYKQEVEREHHMMLEDYLRIEGQTMEELREELADEVRKSLVRSLVLGEIVEQEELEISDDALDAQIAISSEQYGENAERVRESLNQPEQRRGLRNRMLANQAMQRLVIIAKGELGQEAAAEDEAEEDADFEEDASSETGEAGPEAAGPEAAEAEAEAEDSDEA
jgi:trigger factor